MVICKIVTARIKKIRYKIGCVDYIFLAFSPVPGRFDFAKNFQAISVEGQKTTIQTNYILKVILLLTKFKHSISNWTMHVN